MKKCKPDMDGNCQHAVLTGARWWTIPYGTHIIGGRTVSVASFTDLAATSRPSDDVQQQADDLAGDLLRILDQHDVAASLDKEQLMALLVDLSIYAVKRDHKVLDHGIKVGRKHQ